ncbi:unnamed protein product [Rotaria sp. Silwood1]|nr:unnamed protein product [Rotaria sp. Silwood1]CAF3508074.1 unnamed protein product [Rotaria sp. Silwood1]CAF3515543.1 unnamed protein product [Rotaria sp. Silwood1]CAF4673318.1 unnamed protein product [Rotaria sp. Silwood1]
MGCGARKTSMKTIEKATLMTTFRVLNCFLDIQCDTNEKYMCGPSCIKTCDYTPKICTMICQYGCFCKSGYVRMSNDSGSPCIMLKDCSKKANIPKCRINEEYKKCGSACPRTCNNFSYPLSKSPQACIAMCISGCFCKQGYYRSKNGQCVEPEKCCTDDNEQYSECGSACIETCNYTPQFYSSSDPVCGNNEQYTCGADCIETCDYKPTLCSHICRFCCFCQDGYVRQSNNTDSPCVKREDCNKTTESPLCGENEEYQECGSACSRTCDDFSYLTPKKHQVCVTMCVSGCFCKQGYYRANNGQCVEPEKCCTDDNEQYLDCGPACVETCDYVPQLCTLQCVSGCFCQSTDYVRKNNSTASPCIKREQCSE